MMIVSLYICYSVGWKETIIVFQNENNNDPTSFFHFFIIDDTLYSQDNIYDNHYSFLSYISTTKEILNV